MPTPHAAAAAPHDAPSPADLAGFDLQGHRGARGLWPENTREGFAAAAGLGVTSIELDVVLSLDGVPVVHHDLALHPDIARGPDGAWIAPPGLPLAGLRAADLARFDVGRLRPRSRYAARFPAQTAIDGARIPLLADVLAMFRASPVRLDIEIKTGLRRDAPAAAIAGIADAILAVLDAHGAGVALSARAFDWRVLRHLRAARPDLPLAWLTGLGPAATGAAVREAVLRDGWPPYRPVWAPDHRLLRKRQIIAARQAGLAVIPWTVNAPLVMQKLMQWGVDGLCTDRPDLAREILAREFSKRNPARA